MALKVDHHPYALEGKKLKRNGSLLRVYFEDGKTGYADLHPWEKFGDAPLQAQFDSLKSQNFTPLLKQSLYFAKIDAEARSKFQNILENLVIPDSYYLVLDPNDFRPSQDFQFKTLKLKISQNFKLQNFSNIYKDFKLRLDFNQNFSSSAALELTDDLLNRGFMIDYIEDPFSNLEKYRKPPFNCKVARDWDQTIENPDFEIVKPARVLSNTLTPKIYTSYLDHPFGQAYAAYVCATSQDTANTVHGLRSDLVYDKNNFTESWGFSPKFPKLEGTGFGFDSILKDLKWITVI